MERQLLAKGPWIPSAVLRTKMSENRAAAPGAHSLGGDLRAPGCQTVASSFQTTAVQAAGAVTMVTTAKAFPAWYVLGAAWMWMWVADFLGVGDCRGRRQADCVC